MVTPIYATHFDVVQAPCSITACARAIETRCPLGSARGTVMVALTGDGLFCSHLVLNARFVDCSEHDCRSPSPCGVLHNPFHNNTA